MTDPVDIANRALECQLAYYADVKTPGRLERDYELFLMNSARGAADHLGTRDRHEIIRRLGYTPEAVDYYAESERTMVDTARTVAISTDMGEVARFNAGIWYETDPEMVEDVGAMLRRGDLPDDKRMVLGRLREMIPEERRAALTDAEIEDLLVMHSVDWSTLGFEADAEGAHLPVLTREMLPFTEPGFLWFEDPMPYPDYDMDVAATYGIASIGTLLIKAIGWTEVPHVHIGLDADGEPVTGPGLALFMYHELPRSGRLVRSDFTGWGFNTDYSVAHDWKAQSGMNHAIDKLDPVGSHTVNPHIAMVRILLTSIFGIMRSSIELTKPARPVRKRAERSGLSFPEYGDVQVITLRTFLGKATKKSDHTHPTEGVEWRHRWLVRGHWAWRRCNPENADTGEDCRKRVYIESYVKGPEDRPLIIRDKLYAVVR